MGPVGHVSIPDLPPPIRRAKATSLSPSRLRWLQNCQFRALASVAPSDSLPASTVALRGQAIHFVRQHLLAGTWGDSQTALTAARALYGEALRRFSPSTQHFPPMAHPELNLDADPVRRQLRSLAIWADQRRITSTGRQPGSATEALPASMPLEPRLDYGFEALIASPRLGIRGRADEVRQVDPGRIEIIDLKTGSSSVDEGDRLQLRAYALAAQDVDPSVKVSLRIERPGRDPTTVPWGSRERGETQTVIEDAKQLSVQPGGIPSETATAGPWCASCTLRHICPRYLHQAPSWWVSTGPVAKAAPLDTWGYVLEQRVRDAGLLLVLRDLVGRRVRVDGLGGVAQEDQVEIDEPVSLFGLETTEQTLAHGRARFPRNFHDRVPATTPRWRPALAPRLFRG